VALEAVYVLREPFAGEETKNISMTGGFQGRDSFEDLENITPSDSTAVIQSIPIIFKTSHKKPGIIFV
jgi:hypothetical protein